MLLFHTPFIRTRTKKIEIGIMATATRKCSVVRVFSSCMWSRQKQEREHYQSHDDTQQLRASTLYVCAYSSGGSLSCGHRLLYVRTHLEPSREVANHILRGAVLLPLNSLECGANELVEFPERCPPCLRARERVYNQHSHTSTESPTRILRRS